jgi:hypothetical protein
MAPSSATRGGEFTNLQGSPEQRLMPASESFT